MAELADTLSPSNITLVAFMEATKLSARASVQHNPPEHQQQPLITPQGELLMISSRFRQRTLLHFGTVVLIVPTACRSLLLLPPGLLRIFASPGRLRPTVAVTAVAASQQPLLICAAVITRRALASTCSTIIMLSCNGVIACVLLPHPMGCSRAAFLLLRKFANLTTR
jgi:hypothetical protein